MQAYLLVVVALLSAAAAPAEAQSTGTITLHNCLVSLIEEALIPAQQAGVLKEIRAKEGLAFQEGDLLAQIDAEHATRQLEVMQYKLAVAKEQAENDVNVRYSVAAAKVSRAEYDSAVEANQQVEGSIPQAKIRELALATQRNILGIEQAQMDQRIAALESNVSQAEVKAAEENLKRHQITAPLTGEIVEVRHNKGEWVQPGDVVMHIVRLDRLRVEGFVNVADLTPGKVMGRTVDVVVALDNNRQETFRGQVVFVNKLVEAGGEYQVWAEVDNRQEDGEWVLQPGVQATMIIYTQAQGR